MKTFPQPLCIVLCSILAAGVLAAQSRDSAAHARMQAAVEVTFISNCGFLVKAGDEKVLFDLENPDRSGAPECVRNALNLMNANQPPFDNLTCILISHPHNDHLGSRGLMHYLASHPSVRLYSTVDTRPVMRKIDSTAFAAVDTQIIAVDPYDSGTQSLKIGEMLVEFLGLYHAGTPGYMLKDLCFVLSTGGRNILYISDVDPSYAKNVEVLKKAGARYGEYDVLFTPEPNLYKNDWSINGDEILRTHCKARTVIAMHFSEKDMEEEASKVRSSWPGAIIFDRCLETRTFGE